MTAYQFNTKVGRLLESVKRRVAAASEDEIRELRKKLREEQGLVFVNAKPYFRAYKPRNLPRARDLQ